MCNFGKCFARWRPWSVRLSALFVAGLLCAPLSLSADDNSVTVPPSQSPAELLATLRAILTVQEQDAWIVQDYAVYSAAYTNLVDALNAILYELDPSSANSYFSYIYGVISDLSDYADSVGDTVLQSKVGNLSGIIGFLASFVYPTASACLRNAQTIDDEIQLRRVVESATMTLESGAPPESCSCPDYSPYLSDLSLNVDIIRESVVELVIMFEDFFNNSVDPSFWGERAERFHEVLDSLADQFSSLASAAGYTGASDWWLVGSRLGDAAFWYSQLISPLPFDDTGTNSIVSAWRDFLMFRNNHPTNTADNALWVRFLDDLSVNVTNSIDNPVFVQIKGSFTNVVDLSEDSIRALVDALGSFGTNSVYVREEYHERETIERERFEDEEQDLEDPDEITQTIEDIDIAPLRRLNYDSYFKAVRTMFVPFNGLTKPSHLTLYRRRNRSGSGLVPTVEWDLYQDGVVNSALDKIRILFQILWFIVSLRVVAGVIRINVYLLAASARVVYGLAMGDSKAASGGFEKLSKMWADFLTGILGDDYKG